MRRRLAQLLTVVVLTLGAALPATVAAAAPAEAGVVLAVEVDPDAGLEPMDPDDEANEFAPTDYEANFLWGAAVGLLFIVLAVLGGLGAAYWWLIVRPNQAPTRS